MHHFYKDYYWEAGFPHGLDPVDPHSMLKTFKIVTDPYRKQISIEQYQKGQFTKLLYDSKLLDFRHLKKSEQVAWHKETLSETPEEDICLIRNQDDRVLYKEIYRFENKLCKNCQTFSPHELFLSIQKMFYIHCNDPFNGVVLYDNNEHPVMYKTYEIDEQGNFSEMIEEQWNLFLTPIPGGNGKNKI